MDLPNSADLAAGVVTTVFVATGPSTVNVSFCNRTALLAKVRLAITKGADPTAADWLEYDTPLKLAGILERFPLTLPPGGKLFARADVAGVSCVVSGEQES